MIDSPAITHPFTHDYPEHDLVLLTKGSRNVAPRTWKQSRTWDNGCRFSYGSVSACSGKGLLKERMWGLPGRIKSHALSFFLFMPWKISPLGVTVTAEVGQMHCDRLNIPFRDVQLCLAVTQAATCCHTHTNTICRCQLEGISTKARL